MPGRTFRSEGPIHYAQYQFGYCEWLELNEGEEVTGVYEGGYLPFSGRPSDPRCLFYMARSLRVDMRNVGLSKKRRYDHRHWQSFGLERDLQSKQQFMDNHGERAYLLADAWMQSRFGAAFLSRKRFDFIMGRDFLRDILTWHLNGDLLAFALVVRGSWGAHYWYVFYANGDPLQHPPGHGYLVDFVTWAGEQHLPHAYLGTAYGLKSRYKSRGIAGAEFWDGNTWCPAKGLLADLQDAETPAPPVGSH